MLGLSELIGGSARCILKDFEGGIASFRKCLDIRRDVPSNADDAHISAFAQYELGAILSKNSEVLIIFINNQTNGLLIYVALFCCDK